MCKRVVIEIDCKFSASNSSLRFRLNYIRTAIFLFRGEKGRRAPPTRWFPAFRVVNKMASKLSGQWGGWWKSIDGFVAGGGKRNFIIAFVMRFLLYCLQAIVRLEVYREWSGQRVQCRRLFAMYTYTTPAESLIWCVKNTRSSRTGKRFFSFAAIKFSSNFLL